ncbi:MAG TPA: M36 family metallopeptidase [Thermoanaerobaculia bacterium]|nr:M36 family metallopeptidase [Thermoanaerobaculia bacterium]
MRRLAVFTLLSISVAVVPVTAQNRPTWNDRAAQVHGAGAREALTLPSNASDVAVVAQFLAGKGRNAATLGSLAVTGESRRGPMVRALGTGSTPSRARTGLTHTRMEQRVNGRTVYGAYVKAAIDEQGELVHLIENVYEVPAGTPAAAKISEQEALRAALAEVHPALEETPALARRSGETTVFMRDAFFHVEPTVERVLIPMTDGSLENGYVVTTWSDRKNLLHYTLVSGAGEVLNVEKRTNTDTYFVFPIDPSKGSQTTVSGPAPVTPAGTAPSPAGWLNSGTHKTINITGNNVKAYLDAISNNLPDSGGSNVTSGSFTSVFSSTTQPSTTTNRAVAVQNLFYLNNRIHDILYVAGFVESEGNFQTSNFSRGGLPLDAVNAEAQDGGGLDNANFATPGDGLKPRMQMYLWNGKPTHQVVIGSSIYGAAGAAFGPALTTTGRTGPIAVAVPAEGCTALASLTGKIAVIDRGTCDFVTKVKNAQNAGAIGVIVANHATGGNTIMSMGGTDSTITIPSVFVGQGDGVTIKAAAGSSTTIRLSNPAPLKRDGDLDSDIVYHEYGHGLTWRMIGSMSGPLAGAIGEGMGDVLAIVINGDDRVGEYSASDPVGIRSAPYTNYPRTYGNVAGTGVHFDGEVYAAIGWKLRELYLANGLTTTQLLRDMVQGMIFTPAQPKYEQMRDGILAATTTNDCLVWTAFAHYGVGQGASATVSGTTVTVNQSFTIPVGVCP